MLYRDVTEILFIDFNKSPVPSSPDSFSPLLERDFWFLLLSFALAVLSTFKSSFSFDNPFRSAVGVGTYSATGVEKAGRKRN